MHGVDLVYKLPPYEIVTSGTGVNLLTNAEAASIASDGFDVVRLGILWKGLEPGTAPMNDPAICTPGKPKVAGPGQFDMKIFNAYMTKLEQTISLLARHGIYSLIDMHQDSMNEVFAGEGFPELGRLYRRDHSGGLPQRARVGREPDRRRYGPGSGAFLG